MYGMADLQKITGYTSDQLRDRLGRVWGIVAKDHRRGPKNAVLVGDTTLAVLRRMRELEADELGPNEAVKRVMQELGATTNMPTEDAPSVAQGGPKETQPLPNGAPNASAVGSPEWAVVALLAEKDKAIARLEAENLRLVAEVERLLPLALPAPQEETRRPWISRLLRPLISTRP